MFLDACSRYGPLLILPYFTLLNLTDYVKTEVGKLTLAYFDNWILDQRIPILSWIDLKSNNRLY